MIILSLILIIVILIASFFAYRAYVLAGLLADSQDDAEQLELLNNHMFNSIVNTYEKMLEIDHRGAFKSDDEVGTTFESLNSIINELYHTYGEASKEVE